MRFITDDSKSQPKIKRPCVRVICAGLSRCATSSLQAALESDVLGVEPCMHMARIIPHPERQLLVIAALKEVDTPKRRKILHQIFDGYASTADFPGWVFTSDLMDMYPDAVIVLNQRDCPEDWERSMGSTLHFFRSWWYFITTCLWTTNRLHFFVMRETYQLSGRRFGIEKPDFVTFYKKHYEWVRQEANKRGRRVIEWRVKDGWAPLCEALDLEVPENLPPFPRLNDTANMQFVKVILVLRGLLAWATLVAFLWGMWQYLPVLIRNFVACMLSAV